MATADLTQYTQIDVTMEEGDTLNATNATFTDSDGTDYSGYDSGQCLIKEDESDDDVDAVLDFNTADGTLVLLDGSIYFDVLSSVTDTVNGTYYYAVKIKSGTDEYTIMRGTWHIRKRRIN